MPVITPTVGRVVWYFPNGKTQHDAGEQPHSASVAYVHGDRCINIGYFDQNGFAKNATSVTLVQDGDELPEYGFCCWMPFQKGQAAKTEAAEKALAGK
jgi:hypothetical protein